MKKNLHFILIILFVLISLWCNAQPESNANLTVKVYIEGLYSGGGQMNSPILNSGISENAQNIDSLSLFLAEPQSPNTIVFSRRTMLQSNGIAEFNLPSTVVGNQYYLVIKHRNSLETWSKQPITFSESTYYNFAGIYQYPQVTTAVMNNILNNSVNGGGNVLSDGGATVTNKGLVWSISPRPTIALTSKTLNGSGTGAFNSIINGLTANTTYYLRAYATNALGTAYGNEISFTTTNYPVDINGNIYDTVVIGTQTWLAKNLKVTHYRNGDPIPTGLSNLSWETTTSGAYSIYNNSVINDSVYGKLYNWYAVADPRGLCPTGWHVPSNAEWVTLETTLGGSSVAGGAMKEAGVVHWASPNIGATNSSGFTGLPGGNRYSDGTYGGLGTIGYWWSTLQSSAAISYFRYLNYNVSSVGNTINGKTGGFSVRCIRDLLSTLNTSSITNVSNNSAVCGGNIISAGGGIVTGRGVVWSTSPNPTIALTTKTNDGNGVGLFNSNITGLIANTTYYLRAYATNAVGTSYGNEVSFTTMNYPVDINGNIYNTVAIGTQTWFAQNLKVANYRNGDPIPTGFTGSSWGATTSGAYAIFNDLIANDSVYGKLYNWYAVADPRGLCPVGWHVPSDAEWMTLESNLGMLSSDLSLIGGRGSVQNVGGKLKEAGLAHWISPNTGATNSSGFTGLPGGGRYASGSYFNIGTHAYWWSSSQFSNLTACMRDLFFLNSNVGRYTNDWGKSDGFSVRCVKD